MDTRYAKGSLPWREGYFEEYLERRDQGTLSLTPREAKRKEEERLQWHLSTMQRLIRSPIMLIVGGAGLLAISLTVGKKMIDESRKGSPTPTAVPRLYAPTEQTVPTMLRDDRKSIGR